MAIAQLAIQCEEYIGTPNDDDIVVIDPANVDEAATGVENAFLTGEPEKVKEILSPTAKGFYQDLIDGSSPANLKAFGEAFKTRNLAVISEHYAEYEFTVDGTSYSVAMSLGEDGEWKIMRL